MLSNFDLEKLAGFYKLPLIGIHMKNEMPKKPVDGCYIINLQSSTQGNGTHWTKKSYIILIHLVRHPLLR